MVPSETSSPPTVPTRPGESARPRAPHGVIGRTASWAREHWPGLALAAVAVLTASMLGRWLPAMSPLLAAIVLGAVAANTISLPQRLQPGLQFCSKRLLRIGVALLGLQVTFTDILGLGPAALAVVIAVVVLGIGGTMLLGKILGLSWTQRLLIACGFSICGAAAVAAVDSVIDAEEEELLTTIALVVVFGTTLIAIIPAATHTLGLDDQAAGIWAGAAIHEVAQVVAAGGALGGAALTTAVVVKLARVVLLAPVLAVIGWQLRRHTPDSAKNRSTPLVPVFVLAFLACAALRTTGIVPTTALETARTLQITLLTAAMFALGTGVRLHTLARIGIRPLALATAATLWITAIALAGALLAT
ncbi:YeiH family protein [Nocardia lijiangensis]|uniref:YeiH family protein n=1 Tax=Nocardia lijiangensis TaxID=299618 RepID=UPI003D74247F